MVVNPSKIESGKEKVESKYGRVNATSRTIHDTLKRKGKQKITSERRSTNQLCLVGLYSRWLGVEVHRRKKPIMLITAQRSSSGRHLKNRMHLLEFAKKDAAVRVDAPTTWRELPIKWSTRSQPISPSSPSILTKQTASRIAKGQKKLRDANRQDQELCIASSRTKSASP